MNFTLRFNLAHKMTDPWTRYAFWFQFSPIKQFSTWCRNVPGSLWICVISFCLVGKKKHEWQGHDWFRLHTTSFEKAKRAFYYTNHEATHRKQCNSRLLKPSIEISLEVKYLIRNPYIELSPQQCVIWRDVYRRGFPVSIHYWWQFHSQIQVVTGGLFTVHS